MGLAVHFRCHHSEVAGMRIDVMSRMRGVADFDTLWTRRSTFELPEQAVEVLALPDLVQAKKTQRDKDWPMLSRLVEVNYFTNVDHPTPQQIEFWLCELRSPMLLQEVAQRFQVECRRLVAARPLLSLVHGPAETLAQALRDEETRERELDRRYWEPLRRELQRLRRQRADDILPADRCTTLRAVELFVAPRGDDRARSEGHVHHAVRAQLDFRPLVTLLAQQLRGRNEVAPQLRQIGCFRLFTAGTLDMF